MSSRTRIAIDCMGGDVGLRTSLPAAILALSRFPDIELLLVGDAKAIAAGIAGNASNRIQVIHASEVVSMSDRPAMALRNRRQSSMRLAIERVASGDADAVVSAGNTGALMAMGCYVLGTLPGIDRPAICSALPTKNGHCHLLDLGANVDSNAEHLHQFAMMASALAAAIDNNQQARVALLNIGQEESKGNEQVKLAAHLIAEDKQLNFIGYIEGNTLFSGVADIVVCDGFVGNVALKICEGTAAHIADVIKTQFGRSLFSRLAAWCALPILKRVYFILDPQQYNGASFLGLKRVVVKSHGDSSAESFVQAISKARSEVRANVPGLIAAYLAGDQRQQNTHSVR